MNFETIINWLENKVNYCLSELSQRLGVDWIVEQGTSGIWTRNGIVAKQYVGG